jgi:hypothetical protein
MVFTSHAAIARFPVEYQSRINLFLRAPDQTRDVIVRYILAETTIDVQTPPILSFAPIGWTVTVTFTSAPEAARDFSANCAITGLGPASDRYARFALTLA